MTDEEQQIVNQATGENFLGFDDSGNAIIRNAQGQLNAYGGADWAAVTDALKNQHGNKSFNDYVGNEQLKALGGEYQGIDEETGAAVFKKDDKIFGVDKEDADYKNLYNAAQRTDPSKSWFNPEYEKQFNALQDAGATFSGFDDKGQALFKNKLGQYETVANQDAGFYKFAKKYKADEKFSGVEGVSNATAGENITPLGKLTAQSKPGTDANRTRTSLADQTGGFSRFSASASNPGQLQQNVGVSATNSPTSQTAPAYAPPTTASKQQQTAQYNATSAASTAKAKTLKKKAAAPVQAEPMGIKDIAMKMGKEYATNFANQKLAEAKTTAKTAAIDYAKDQTQPYFDSAKTAAQPYKDGALSSLKDATGFDATKSATDQAANAASNAVGFDVNAAMNDPKAYLRAQAESQLDKQLGFNASSIINDPANFLKTAGGQALNAQLGFNATDLINDPRNFMSEAGTDLLAKYAGDDMGMLGQAATLLRGNVVENARNLAKEEAKKQALAQVGSMSGVDVNAIQGGLDVSKEILKGGMDAETANKAGQTAARAGLTAVSGGLASPESLQLSADLQNKAYGALENKLGTVGSLLGASTLGVGAVGAQAGADLANIGINAVGDSAANTFGTIKDIGGGLQMIGKGDLGGVGDIAKAALNNVVKTAVTAPVAVAKQVVSAVSNAISSIFCFDGDTEILMEDGSYKKIKHIKLGDKVELGGLVTAIGQSASDEIYDYRGVKVSSGHALFEDGKWTRVSESKYGKEIKGDKRLVFPMSTEHHLIVTKGQIWADNLEVDDTYDKKDSDIMKELNKKTVRNKMLKTYLKVKFGIN